MEQNRTLQSWPLVSLRSHKTVACDQQIIRTLDAEHLHAHQDRCDDNSMHTVHADRVDALEPGESVSAFVHKAYVRTQTGNSASRFNAPKDILPGQMLVLDRNGGLAVNPRSTKLLERCRRQAR